MSRILQQLAPLFVLFGIGMGALAGVMLYLFYTHDLWRCLP